jgi:hypothetical protein
MVRSTTPKYCFQHKNGPKVQYAGPPTRQSLADGKKPLPPKDRKSAATDICTDAWVDFANGQFTAVLGPALWQKIVEAWQPSNCQDLAALARLIETLTRGPINAVRSSASDACNGLGVPPSIGEAVLLLVVATHLPWLIHLDGIAFSIRMIGIFKCVILSEELTECACLKDLSTGLIKDQLKVLLAQVIPDTGDNAQPKPAV